MNRTELESQGYYTINKLMELTGNDRRTISKKLKGQEPDKVHKNTNYYELNRVIEILEEESGRGSEKNKLECKKIISQIKNIDLRRVMPPSYWG